ncbi:MAG: hypothetical protein IM536_11115 [Pseudanabaena sp. M34BS1SP1A06MG]|nr:hypothetical protein [Pseudanabaena sp. M34BS1SP1A06MG]
MSGALVIKRQIASAVFESISTGLNITDASWALLRVVRKGNVLSIKVNESAATLIFNYKIQSGTFKIGNFTGDVKNIGYKSVALPWLLSISADVFASALTAHKPSNNQICYLKYADEIGNFTKLIDATTNDYKTQTKLVTPNSLIIQSARPLTSSFTVELRFLSANIGANVELLSYWDSPNLSFFVRKLGNLLKFGRLNSSTISLQDIGTFDPSNEVQVLKLEFNQFAVKVWLNGLLKLTTTLQIKIPSYKFWFNSSKYQAPTGNFSLISFSAYERIANLDQYFPQVATLLPQSKVEQFYPINFRNKTSSTFQGIFSRRIFSVAGSSAVAPNSTTTYTITQTGSYSDSTVYFLHLLIPDNSDWQVNEATLNVSTVSVAPNSLTATFQLVLSNFAVRPARTPITIRVSNGTYYQDYEVSLNESRTFGITNISGYLDGYFAKSSITSGTIPNLTSTSNATTSSTLETSLLYGKTYKIANSGQKINLSSSVVGVRTLFFVYRELAAKSYRKYVGATAGYTFNGGSGTQLVGSLQFTSGDFVKVSTQSGRFSKVAISEDESNLVYIDDLANTVKVVRRITGVWAFGSAVTLPLTSGDAAALANASLQINSTGDLICIGVKNSNLGEGRVLHFTRTGVATWTSSLNLGQTSPVPYVDGFGLAAFVKDDNTALLASVQGSNHIYKFTSTSGIYNTTPTNVFNFFGKKILGNSTLSRWVAQDNSGNVRVFDSDLLTQTITGADLDFALKGDYLATANFAGEVKIWKYETGTWTVIKTITSATTNFGYSLSFNASYDLLVGSPNESTSFLYLFSDNWTTPKSFVSTGLYGYANALAANSVLISNYTNEVEFYSSDGASIPQIITDARQKKASTPLDSNLDSTDAQVLVFSSASALTVDSIATDVQGLWLGCLLYNRQLTTAEIQDIETNLYEYLGLAERSLYG